MILNYTFHPTESNRLKSTNLQQQHSREYKIRTINGANEGHLGLLSFVPCRQARCRKQIRRRKENYKIIFRKLGLYIYIYIYI